MFSTVKDSSTKNGYFAPSVKEFLIDSDSDVSSLPTDCIAGSVAYTANLSSVYILSNLKVWTKVGD